MVDEWMQVRSVGRSWAWVMLSSEGQMPMAKAVAKVMAQGPQS